MRDLCLSRQGGPATPTGQIFVLREAGNGGHAAVKRVASTRCVEYGYFSGKVLSFYMTLVYYFAIRIISQTQQATPVHLCMMLDTLYPSPPISAAERDAESVALPIS